MQGRTYDLLRKSSKRAKIKQSQSGAIAIAIFHATTKPVSRTSGRTAVAAAAYRSASTLVHQETGNAVATDGMAPGKSNFVQFGSQIR